jgi:Uma2 family endonuclease
MATQEKLLTADDLLALPDEGKKRELVRGVIVEMAPPNAEHGSLALRLGRFIGALVDEKKLGLATVETGYVLSKEPTTVRAPDIAFISSARLENVDLRGYIPIAPDLAVEVVSPGDTASEVVTKVAEYIQAGTRLVWVVYPDVKKVYVYQTAEAAKIVDINGVLDGADVLPGFSLAVQALFEGLQV